MCGIIGIFGRENAKKQARAGLFAMKYRGRDGTKVLAISTVMGKESALGHCLHSLVGDVPQPLHDKKAGAYFAANCEIYNWKELCKRNNIKAKNDAELLFRLLLKKGVSDETLSELDGVYAFSFADLKAGKIYLARDILGIKPMWYSITDGFSRRFSGGSSGGFSFASEKKALEKIGVCNAVELNPRKILVYNFSGKPDEFVERQFFDITAELKDDENTILMELEKKLSLAVAKRIPNKKFGVLFSGGIDATIIAKLIQICGENFKKREVLCYTAGFRTGKNSDTASDIIYAKRIAKENNFELKIVEISEKEAEEMLKTIVPLIEDNNPIKAGVALTLFAACRQAKKDGCKVIFSGLGSDELFAGYNRFKTTPSGKINSECLSNLLKMYEKDTYRDDVITMYHNLEIRLPFLDREFVKYSLQVPEKFKIMQSEISPKNAFSDKIIIRKLGRNLGLSELVVGRKKKAAQYGSNADRMIEKLTRKNKFKSRSDYLRTLYKTHNVKLAGLVSTGKDSIYALSVMAQQNYDICCIIGIVSKNPDSYMFHTPNIHLIKLQAEAMGLPLVLVETTGEKEVELKDLKTAFTQAKEKHGAEGVVSGALYSSYQRDRIEKVADSLGLKVFSPLWHMNQESEMRELLGKDFEIIFSSIAAEGLDKSWLGRKITAADVDTLVALHKKFGINIAGEGGEFESLVLDCPLFEKKIVIKNSRIVVQSQNTARFIVEEAELTKKITKNNINDEKQKSYWQVPSTWHSTA